MVAVIARPIMKRENVFCLLKAIRPAINEETFKRPKFDFCKTNFF
jgi:hypothetical protein